MVNSQKVIVVSGFTGFIITKNLQLRIQLNTGIVIYFQLLCFLLLFFFVVCKDCDKSYLFNLKRRGGDNRWMKGDIRVKIANTTSQ